MILVPIGWIPTLLLLLPLMSANPPCSQYGVCKHFEFVPAQPGDTPKCAKPGSTFCESLDHYPKELIRYLIEKWGFDYNTLLSDESRDLFSDRVEYGPVPNQIYHHHPHRSHSTFVLQPSISYGPVSANISQVGYPERTYKIDPQIFTNGLQHPPPFQGETNFVHKGGGFLYSTSVLEPQSSAQWWSRRTIRSQPRQKRQTPTTNTLCPTTSSYIMPRAALNTRGNWMYTVNLNEVDDRYTQLVQSQTCISQQCSGLCQLPNGYSSRCEQQYVQKRLVALEGNGERLYTDVFWFPHCCLCQITPNN